MANHGYISRDGKNISAQDVTRGLKECYGLSSPLAYFLAYVGFMILRRCGRINLFDIDKHGAIEHDASLVHRDAPESEKFAPIEIDPQLVEALCADVKPTSKECERDGGARWLMNYEDVARARVRREGECKRIDAVHAEIARGEMAIILGVWETKTETKVGIPMEYFKPWISEERLPDGWKPDHVQGFFDVVKRSKSIRKAAEKLREEAATAREATSSSAKGN
jgi:hypothetical protein